MVDGLGVVVEDDIMVARHGVSEEVEHSEALMDGSARCHGEEGEARHHLDGAGHDEEELWWLEVEEEA